MYFGICFTNQLIEIIQSIRIHSFSLLNDAQCTLPRSAINFPKPVHRATCTLCACIKLQFSPFIHQQFRTEVICFCSCYFPVELARELTWHFERGNGCQRKISQIQDEYRKKQIEILEKANCEVHSLLINIFEIPKADGRFEVAPGIIIIIIELFDKVLLLLFFLNWQIICLWAYRRHFI